MRLLSIALAFAVAFGASTARGDRDDRPKQGVVEHDIVRGGLEDDEAIKSVVVDNRLGNVEIEGHDKNEIVVIVVKRAPDQDTLNRLRVALVSNPNGAISIGTALKASAVESRPVPAGSVRVDLVVRAPRTAKVGARLWNGSVEVKSVDNGADLTVNEGSIDVRHVSGAIKTQSAVGGQRFLELIDATIRAQAVHGDMNLDTITGEELEATVHDGSVTGRNVRVSNAVVRTTTGDITFHGEIKAGGVYRLASVRGDVELKVRVVGSVKVQARAQKGTVSLPSSFEARDDLETGFVTGSFGTGKEAAQISLRSTHGSVTLVDWDF